MCGAAAAWARCSASRSATAIATPKAGKSSIMARTRASSPTVRSPGKTLHELVTEHGPALFGRHHPQPQFPLLLKFLDAQLTLSVQVHPERRPRRHAHAARSRQDRGLGRAGRRAGEQDLRRPQAGRRSRAARARAGGRQLRRVPPSARAARSAIASSSKPARSTRSATDW